MGALQREGMCWWLCQINTYILNLFVWRFKYSFRKSQESHSSFLVISPLFSPLSTEIRGTVVQHWSSFNAGLIVASWKWWCLQVKWGFLNLAEIRLIMSFTHDFLFLMTNCCKHKHWIGDWKLLVENCREWVVHTLTYFVTWVLQCGWSTKVFKSYLVVMCIQNDTCRSSFWKTKTFHPCLINIS